MSIQSILNRKGTKVTTTRASETVRRTADLMSEYATAAPIVKGNDPVSGIITVRDIVSALSRHGETALSLVVRDVMSHPITVAANDPSIHAMRLMKRHRVRHLPVVADGKLADIVSIGDVVKDRLEELDAESNVLRDAYIAAR